MTNISTELRNYFKLERLIGHARITLRNLFKSRYLQFHGTAWTDSPTCGNNYFTSLNNKNRKDLKPFQKDLIQEGNSNEWDPATLISVLLSMSHSQTLTANEIQQLDQENQSLEQLKSVRNELEHHATKLISDIEFNKLWTEITTILIMFGNQDTELDQFKDDSVFDAPKEIIDEESARVAVRLNSLGVQEIKAKNYVEAIQFFTQAAKLPNISCQDQATAF